MLKNCVQSTALLRRPRHPDLFLVLRASQKKKSEFLVLQIMKKGDIFLMFLNKHQSMEDWPVLADRQVQQVLGQS